MPRCFKLYTYYLNNNNLKSNIIVFEESYSCNLFNLSFNDISSKTNENKNNDCKYYNITNYDNKSDLKDFINIINQKELKIDLSLDNIDDYININIIRNYFNSIAAKVKNINIKFEAIIDFEYNICYFNNKHSKFYNSVEVLKNISLLINKYYKINYILSIDYKEKSSKEEKNIFNYLCMYTCELETNKNFLVNIKKSIINDNKVNYKKFNKLDAVKLILPDNNIDENKIEKNNILDYISITNIQTYIENFIKSAAIIENEFFIEFFLDTVKNKLHLVTYTN